MGEINPALLMSFDSKAILHRLPEVQISMLHTTKVKLLVSYIKHLSAEEIIGPFNMLR